MSCAEGKTAFDAVAACFPAGTLSGAPKPRAMELIEELEPTRRGLYGGVVGYLDFAGDADTAIAIRTALMRDGVAYVQAGGGIVADSDPVAEDDECVNKAGAVLAAIATAADDAPCGGWSSRVTVGRAARSVHCGSSRCCCSRAAAALWGATRVSWGSGAPSSRRRSCSRCSPSLALAAAVAGVFAVGGWARTACSARSSWWRAVYVVRWEFTGRGRLSGSVAGRGLALLGGLLLVAAGAADRALRGQAADHGRRVPARWPEPVPATRTRTCGTALSRARIPPTTGREPETRGQCRRTVAGLASLERDTGQGW